MPSDQDEGTAPKVALPGLSVAGPHPSLRGPLPRPACVFPPLGLPSFLPAPCPSTSLVFPSSHPLWLSTVVGAPSH